MLRHDTMLRDYGCAQKLALQEPVLVYHTGLKKNYYIYNFISPSQHGSITVMIIFIHQIHGRKHTRNNN